jgi:GNAT superfamily N-acetyltransferase
MADRPARIAVGWACENDLVWLFRHDPHISKAMMRQKVACHEVAVAHKAGEPIGLLRYSLFCDWIPFIVFVFVPEDQRGRGAGSRLVAFLERQMRRRRCRFVMVSSRSDGHSQHFWRKLGYRDAGSLQPSDEPFELLFTKRL